MAMHAVLASGFPVGPSIMAVAFQDDGMFLSYPLYDQRSWSSWTGTCTQGGHAKVGYDPRCVASLCVCVCVCVCLSVSVCICVS